MKHKKSNKICKICGFEFKGHATFEAHKRLHNSKYCEIVGSCISCGKQISFFGRNATEANKSGKLAEWKCENCQS